VDWTSHLKREENHRLKTLCFHEHGGVNVVEDTSALGPERSVGEVLARLWTAPPNYRGFREVPGLIWSGKLEPMAGGMMPFLEDKRAVKILECREQSGEIGLAP
jgi:hypothetical protein